MILIQFKPCDLGIVHIFKYLGFKIGAILIGSFLQMFLQCLLRIHRPCLEYPESNESDESNE